MSVSEEELEKLRFPIGRFDPEAADTSSGALGRAIERIEAAPANLRIAVEGLSAEELDTPYRPDGWTVRQVVHHLPDSHMNSYTRFKLALTEDVPEIRPYFEDRWALLADAAAPVELSLDLLDALHRRWVVLLRSFGPAELGRRFRHPEIGELDVATNVAMYAWHGDHHIAHVTSLRERSGW